MELAGGSEGCTHPLPTLPCPNQNQMGMKVMKKV